MAASCASLRQKALVPLLSFTFAAWIISLGGLGSMQYLCVDPAITFSNTAANAGWLAGVSGPSPMINTCTALYAYYWMMVALEFAVIMGLAYTLVGGCMAQMRVSWYYQSGLEMHTARGTAVGFIVTAVLDLCLILLIGASEGNAEGCGAGGKRAAPNADRV
ncbi:hypothetical protein Rsub_01304 [Raphidocelis subcapitata]|uniref:Uncharacterized protein n=1 Tax=Raphidocelis subcapitata TaxID=307507 RepID=A0A2V0NN33_9CHLO|nr:hypothetical protein Rsub_01304 [Raphidocelis subcapitata]|eukprot:GBF88589.1 hypothetical protein Rsub_01304 [Raphidocelis subcapitata]